MFVKLFTSLGALLTLGFWVVFFHLFHEKVKCDIFCFLDAIFFPENNTVLLLDIAGGLCFLAD